MVRRHMDLDGVAKCPPLVSSVSLAITLTVGELFEIKMWDTGAHPSAENSTETLTAGIEDCQLGFETRANHESG